MVYYHVKVDHAQLRMYTTDLNTTNKITKWRTSNNPTKEKYPVYTKKAKIKKKETKNNGTYKKQMTGW